MKLPGFAPPAFTNIFNCRGKSRRYTILPLEVREDLKFVATGKRLCLCYVLCVWTLGRFKCVGWHGLGSGCGCEAGNLFLELFLPLLITHLASELAFLSPNSGVPGAFMMQGLISRITTICIRRPKKYFFYLLVKEFLGGAGEGIVFAWKIPW